MPEIQDKLLRVRVAIAALEGYYAAGGKDRSMAEFPFIEELMQAFGDLAKELGREIVHKLKP